MATSGELIESLFGTIDQVLSPLIPSGSKCALLDFPFHGNVGDSAIWLGEKHWLSRRGVNVAYEADMFSFRQEAVRSLGDEVVVLVTGGGSFGDIWPLAQAAREKVLAQLADRRIIQLPQTVYFDSPEKLARACGVIDAQRDFTLLCRDSRTLELARAYFACQSLLCPDMAFALGSLAPLTEAETDCVWLGRTDKESAWPKDALQDGASFQDWVTEDASPLLSERWQALRRVISNEVADDESIQAFSRVNDALAEARLSRGMMLLSKGRAVVTDRLHGHILATLLGKPHVLIDNSYGKNRAFYETWTRDCDVVELVAPNEASLADSLRRLRKRVT